MMFRWTEENEELVLRISRPENPFLPLLHAEIDAFCLGVPYRIEWPAKDDMTQEERAEWLEVVRLAFDGELAGDRRDEIVRVVQNHNGLDAIESNEAREAKIASVKANAAPVAETARQKRLRGETLTQEELIALVDLAIFGP